MYKPHPPMRDIDEQFKRTAVMTGMILVAASTLLVWDAHNSFVLGLLLGGVGGLFNAHSLIRRMNMMMGFEPKHANTFMKHGCYLRMGFIIALAFIASRTEALSLFGLGAGILMVTLITATDSLLYLRRYFAAQGVVDRM